MSKPAMIRARVDPALKEEVEGLERLALVLVREQCGLL